MKVSLQERALAALGDAEPAVQRAFIKQLNFLVRNLQHPSLHAKKYDEAKDRWQARVNNDWRFYFTIEDDTYVIDDVIPHPK
jgi:plasmid maintenance system killer protein